MCARLTQAREGELRPQRRAQSRPHVGGGVSSMQTTFTLAQLADPQIAESEKILRACVHCGFCTATCPTYVLLGDELDCPRGRIYLIKEMLENERPATADVVKHIDRCLSCLACMTTCPSGVHYMHLVDHAREHIEKTYQRPLFDRACARCWRACCRIRRCSGWRALGGLLAQAVRACWLRVGLKPLAAMLRLAPRAHAGAAGERTGRSIRREGAAAAASRCCPAASIRCWRRRSTRPPSACSTATASRWWLPRARPVAARSSITWAARSEALAQARNNIDAWTREIEGAAASTPS